MINNKFLYALTLDDFNAIKETIINSPIDPIVFIEKEKKLWICNKLFDIGYPNVSWEVIKQQAVLTIGDLGDLTNQKQVVLSVAGNSLSLSGTGNNIVISSNALTTINTDDVLQWNLDRLSHKDSGVAVGSYGETQQLDKVNTFKVPYFTVDSKGHIKLAGESTIIIRDYVVQEAVGVVNEDRNILTSGDKTDQQYAGHVKKGNSITYNDFTKTLKVDKIVSKGIRVENGDIEVVGGKFKGEFEGDLSGSATPKVHLSAKPEYGGASTNLYGHVKVQDDLGVIAPPPSSTNEVITSTDTEAKAASPLMVWNVKEELKTKIDKKIDSPTETTKGVIPFYDANGIASLAPGKEGQALEMQQGVPVWKDQKNISQITTDNGITVIVKDTELVIKGSGGVVVSSTAEGIIVSPRPIEILNNNNQPSNVTGKLSFGDDFKLNEKEEVAMNWLELK